MNLNYISVKSILEQSSVESSAPCRIDTGGTWDIKAMSLPFENIRPVTVNIALNLRTIVTLKPFKNGRIRITSEGFKSAEEYGIENLPLNSSFGIFFAAISYYGYHGLEAEISSGSPVKSALGGSSTALVALIKSLSKLDNILHGNRKASKRDILHLGYHIEDGISGGNCGIQDQAAAVYGGVNQWTWSYGSRKAVFTRKPLLDRSGIKDLSDHILTAYSGMSHVSARTNQIWLKDFLSGKTRRGWIEANEAVKGFAIALKNKAWSAAAQYISNEMKIRRRITPDAMIDITDAMIKTAEKTGCGARFTGAGAGGSVWAIGEKDSISALGKKWKDMLKTVKGAAILDCGTDASGVR